MKGRSFHQALTTRPLKGRMLRERRFITSLAVSLLPGCGHDLIRWRSIGSSFFYYGPCYMDTHAYTVEIDGNANSQPQIYNASVPWGGNIIEGCLRYHEAGLSKGTQHEILVTNAESHWITLSWLEVWDYELVDQGSGARSYVPCFLYLQRLY
jgi:hypothetical protein